MDNSNTKSRTFLGTIAAAIKAVCLVLIDLMGVAQDGVAMADKAVGVARRRQAVELDISMVGFEDVAAKKAAQDMATATESLQKWVDADNTGARKEAVEKNFAKLKAAIDKGQAEIELQRKRRFSA